jgi:hypothetical protein
MGQPVKFSDRKKEWYLRSQKSDSRRSEALAERERILIVCEGERTEPNYFLEIGKTLPPHVIELIIEGMGMNTLSLVREAIRLRDNKEESLQPYDQTWVVFDKDDFPPNDFNSAITLCDQQGLKAAFSNEAFELWYVLHFEYRTTAMPRTEYKAKLSTLLGRPYAKNALDMYQVLDAMGSQASAIKWAQRLHKAVTDNHITPANANPCTTVYQLVEVLNAFKPEPPTDT